MALLACDSELTKAENFRKNDMEHEARLTGTYSPELEGGGGPGMPGPGGVRGGGYGNSDGSGVRPLRPTSGMTGDGLGSSEAGGYVDPSMMDPKHYRVEYMRRRIRQDLYAVQLGLTGGDDHAPPKERTTGAPPTPATAAAAAAAAAEKKEPRGVFAVAKTQAERDEVDKVYHKVRKLIEAVENAGATTDFLVVVKDVRKEMKPLEATIGKRLPPPGAATAPGTDDVPSIPGKAGPKTTPASKTPTGPGARPGKAAVRPAASAAQRFWSAANRSLGSESDFSFTTNPRPIWPPVAVLGFISGIGAIARVSMRFSTRCRVAVLGNRL